MPDNISQEVSIEGEGNVVIGNARDVTVNPLPPLLPAEVRLRHDLGMYVLKAFGHNLMETLCLSDRIIYYPL